MKSVFLVCYLLFSVSLFSQKVGYKIIDSSEFVIQQKHTYTNPNYDKNKPYNLDGIEPCFNETYVSDENIKTLSDLKKFYQKGKIWLPDDWPFSIILDEATFKLAIFENGAIVPILLTLDGTVFSFLIEEDLLAIDVLNRYEEDGVWKVKFDTCEIEKLK